MTARKLKMINFVFHLVWVQVHHLYWWTMSFSSVQLDCPP